jgi:hypothetical protein
VPHVGLQSFKFSLTCLPLFFDNPHFRAAVLLHYIPSRREERKRELAASLSNFNIISMLKLQMHCSFIPFFEQHQPARRNASTTVCSYGIT